MAEQQRKMLQALMGDSMYASESASSSPQLSITDPKVCRSYLAGTCPHDLFTNTKNDLGPCPKIHSEALKTQYDNASAEEKQKWFFEYDYLRDMQRHIDECDRKIVIAQKRLEKTPEEIRQTNALLRQIADLEETIKASLVEIKILAEKLGKVNMAVTEHYKCRQLQLKKQEHERELRNLGETGGPSGHQKLQVCDVCGAYLSRLDNDRRLADHFFGKMHLGYAQMRRTHETLREEIKGRAPPVRDQDYGGNPNAIRNDEERGGGFGRRGGFDGPRGGRGGWRGGRGGYGRGGGGRFINQDALEMPPPAPPRGVRARSFDQGWLPDRWLAIRWGMEPFYNERNRRDWDRPEQAKISYRHSFDNQPLSSDDEEPEYIDEFGRDEFGRDMSIRRADRERKEQEVKEQEIKEQELREQMRTEQDCKMQNTEEHKILGRAKSFEDRMPLDRPVIPRGPPSAPIRREFRREAVAIPPGPLSAPLYRESHYRNFGSHLPPIGPSAAARQASNYPIEASRGRYRSSRYLPKYSPREDPGELFPHKLSQWEHDNYVADHHDDHAAYHYDNYIAYQQDHVSYHQENPEQQDLDYGDRWV